MSIWFTSDSHYGHARIVQLCHRPFATVDEMDTCLIDRLNRCVGVRDELYHLGDFAWSGTWRDYRDRITCERIHLLRGNHDSGKEARRALRDGLFETVHDYLELKDHGVRFVLCHYPFQSWRPHSIHLHGHSHGMSSKVAGRMDVGVDANSYAPVPLSLVVEMCQPTPDDDGRHDVGKIPDMTMPDPVLSDLDQRWRD